MREINLDAASWTTPLDFYAALLPALGAPEWHGNSIPAILDSMIGGEINAVEPPYVVKIHNLAGRPDPLIEEVSTLCKPLRAGVPVIASAMMRTWMSLLNS